MSSTFEPGGSIGSTGSVIDFVLPLEVREIAVIEGVENHESDVIAKNQYIDSLEAKLDADPSSFRDDPLLSQLSANTWGSDEQRAEQIKKSLEKQRPYSTFSYLEKTLGSDFAVDAGRKSASYLSVAQNVQYNFRIHHLLDEYKTALETPGLIVVYIGHSRYGRGPCCYDYEGKIPPQGEQWEDGTTATDGIFRMGYPYVPVEFEDMENHRYMFRPVPGEWDPPPNEFAAPKSRHPDARRSLSRITLPDDLQQFICQPVNRPFLELAKHLQGMPVDKLRSIAESLLEITY
jgi:hypothetical protein